MKAFVIEEAGKTAIVERDCPTPSAGEVLLRVRCVGFCGSDLNTFRGLNPLVSYPRIPGHEVAASIVDAGTDVSTRFPSGQDVLVMPYTACGKCRSNTRISYTKPNSASAETPALKSSRRINSSSVSA